ncbi:MAG: AGE family epimerase/isomerase [Bacteroidetes bacterium]|nr:AGE family epimerase/isomerase [Bacteroidota bacterium]
MNKKILSYQDELKQELDSILTYWINRTIDNTNGGFVGRIDENEDIDHNSSKGLVLNSRLLWTFSAAYNQTKNEIYLHLAYRAYSFITIHFKDVEFGGVYWTVDADGKPLDKRKQIYGLAFCQYGLTEFYKATKNDKAKEFAIDLFNIIEKYSFDNINLGYFEAFTQDWKEIDDLRLSKKDDNEKKTMNTHLHVIESYANLYKIWPNPKVKIQIQNLLKVFHNYIINLETNHLNLFFDENWTIKSDLVSYGHDIEAAWLLLEAAEVISDHRWIEIFKQISINITEAALTGLDKNGGLWYEYLPAKDLLVTEKHWWPQAEAMVGLFNAYQITHNNKYLTLSLQTWSFVKKHIKDNKFGEWIWGVEADNSPMKNQDKVGFWKCPYHNSRACIEIVNRIEKL